MYVIIYVLTANKTREGENHLAWFLDPSAATSTTALHRPLWRPLDVCAFSFSPSRPSLTGLELEGDTYPGDHVKVGTGLMFLLPPPGFTSNRVCQLTEVEGKDTP